VRYEGDLEICSLKLPVGSAAGKLLASDINGVASWKTAAELGLGGGGVVPATQAALGTVKLSAAPANPLLPVAVETGDARMSDARTPTAHTHVQADVTGLVTTLAAKEATANKGAVSGYAPLDGTSKVPLANLGGLTNTEMAAGAAIVESKLSLASDAAAGTASRRTLGIAATAAAPGNLASTYRTLLDCSGSHTAARVAGTYGFGQGDPLAISGTGTLYPLNTIFIAVADFQTLAGIAPKLRLRAQLYVNDVAPTGNFTFGLYPVTRPATSGAAGLVIYTLGTVVTGSPPAAVAAPAADSSNVATGSDFALPADGHYVIGVVTTAAVAASSHLHLSAVLQMRNA
jgi:hypothetical protein